MKTVIWKEWNEHLRWVPFGLLPMVVVLAYQWRSRTVIFDENNGLSFAAALIGSIVAGGLGLMQSWPDERPAARALLLHRGLAVETVFAAKLLAGLSLYGLVMFSPLLCLAIWIAASGQASAAAYPDAVLPPLLVAATAFAAWPAAFLVVRRDCRLIGSRLLPAVAAVALVALAVEIVGGKGLLGPAAFVAATLALFLSAARSAFRNSSGQPSGLGRAALAGTMIVGLFSATLAVAIGSLAFFHNRAAADYPPQYAVQFGPDGACWLTRKRYVWKSYRQEIDRVAKLLPNESARTSLEPVPDDWQPLATWTLSDNPYRPGQLGKPFATLSSARVGGASYPMNRYWVVDTRQHELAVYRQGREFVLENRLELGRRAAAGPAANRLDGVSFFPSWQSAGHDGFVLPTSSTIYFAPTDGQSVELLYELPADSELQAFHVTPNEVPATERAASPQRLEAAARFSDRVVLLENDAEEHRLSATSVGDSPTLGEFMRTEFRLPEPLKRADSLQLARSPTDSGQFLGIAEFYEGDLPRFVWCRFAPDGQVIESREFTEDTLADSSGGQTPFAFAAIPPGLAAISLAIIWSYEPASRESMIVQIRRYPKQAVIGAAMILLSGLTGLIVAVWAAGRRRLSSALARPWALVGFLFGPAGGLSLLAVHPRIERETCVVCLRRTRRDHNTCEACGAELHEPTRSGVEIFDNESAFRAAPVVEAAD